MCLFLLAKRLGECVLGVLRLPQTHFAQEVRPFDPASSTLQQDERQN
jgi:hypothetical protein